MEMLETNIKLIKYGTRLRLKTRIATLRGQILTPKVLQKCCRTLKNEQGVAAIPYNLSDQPSLLVATDKITTTEARDDECCVEISDSGQTQTLKFYQQEDQEFISNLVERCLLIEIPRRTNFWKIDSPRIWYEEEPFDTEGDIEAYRRYRASAIPIEGVGIGISLHVGTSFFTRRSVDEYLGDHLPDDVKLERKRRFNFLSQRQLRQKGTLVYNAGTSKVKCYFEKFQKGVTCATTGPLVIAGCRYDSLIEYYREKRSYLPVEDDSPVVYVSFPDLPTRPVAANLVRLRVMNEVLPRRLKTIDKIPPQRRNSYIEDFWKKLGPDPLGKGMPGLEEGLWMPESKRQVFFTIPGIKYSNGNILEPPEKIDVKEYRNHFWQRRRFLKEKKCYHIPTAIDREIHFALPQEVDEETGKRLADDMVEYISTCTEMEFDKPLFHYLTIEEAIKKLYPRSGSLVFVFEKEDPATYFNIAYQLKSWRIKHITRDTLQEKYAQLREALKEAPSEKIPQGLRDWNSFIELSAQDVMQMMEIIPFVVAQELPYEGQLAIDVGEQKRYFAVSLLICRSQGQPDFYLRTVVPTKADHKSEAINKVHLTDEIVGLFKKIGFRKFDPLKSLLILRDGGICGEELEGIKNAITELTSSQFLEQNATIHGADFRKSSEKEIRFWDRIEDLTTKRINVMEGAGIIIGQKELVLSNTGRSTIGQGTTEPIALTIWDDPMNRGADLKIIAYTISLSTHFNWSSPGKSQRLPIYFKRTDDELKKKQMQDIRRIT